MDSYSKLRVFENELNVEVLRHQKFKVPLDQMTCPLCFTEYEDEIHFLHNCDELREQHQSSEQKLGKFGIKYFGKLTNEQKLYCCFQMRILKYVVF